jgi:hypothetical protein
MDAGNKNKFHLLLLLLIYLDGAQHHRCLRHSHELVLDTSINYGLVDTQTLDLLVYPKNLPSANITVDNKYIHSFCVLIFLIITSIFSKVFCFILAKFFVATYNLSKKSGICAVATHVVTVYKKIYKHKPEFINSKKLFHRKNTFFEKDV